MLRLAADENLNGRIVRGLLRQLPQLDIVRIQDAGLSGADDHTVLQWAADNGRVLLTHDVSTMTRWATDRVNSGEPMPGVVQVGTDVPVGQAISELALLVTAGTPEDCENQVLFVPLR
jgi:predicted nuclease of predicted toxin-antitoxin system